MSSILFDEFAFWQIHQLHHFILIWIIDLIILSIPVQVVFFVNYHIQKSRQLKTEIDALKSKIHSSIELATRIGEGKLNRFEAADDELAAALIALGKSLSGTRKKEDDLNWIARGKERVSDILRITTTIDELTINVLKATIDYTGAIQGGIFLPEGDVLVNAAAYAFNRQRYEKMQIPIGKGLVGEVAYEKQMIYRTEIPDDYFTLTSGLIGDKKPKSLIVIPLMQEDELQGVMELAFLNNKLPKYILHFIEEISNIIGRTIYNLKINIRTAQLLKESQELTIVLKENEQTLHENAREMMVAQENLEKSNKLLANQIQEVEHGQKRLQALLTNASEFISIYNEKQELVFESPSVKRILGYNDNDKVSGMDPELLTPRGFKTINNLFQFLLETPGGEHVAQYTYLKKNGEKLFLETKGKNLLHDPAIRGIIFNTQDITERKRAEKEERMKSRMQSLSENSPDMILRISNTGKLVYVNPAISKFIGVPSTEIIKKRIYELDIDPQFIDFVRTSLSTMREDPKQMVAEIEMQSHGDMRIMEIKAIPEFSEDQELESVLFVTHDLTEMKIIEQEIKDKNKKISDSINYAQRIQTSILPDTGVIQQYFPRSFIFYRPKDVVSGDFPWFFMKDDIFYIAAVDCTGHGVPGALLSLIGYFLLNNIVNADKDLSASEILDQLHQKVRRTLRQDQDGANGRDGMDLALCKINPKKNELQYAGAHRPLYYLRNGELTEYKGSRKAIGGIPLAKKIELDFENNIIDYQTGDKFFIFSDGLPDQTGKDGKKYLNKRIREALTEDKDATMAHYARFFSKDFYDWMGEEKQVDDVLLIGIEL
ncbi:PAS domain S-box protein [Breznakibacter xylanolyticus]|uniref:PAS domain S-box protein n=1 Tax=Breznakibacter xylanolyticus TaxID=990 RepID=UPI001FE43199|nr:PAS domain S-box protein [Breznakibacter xylanolyticus]